MQRLFSVFAAAMLVLAFGAAPVLAAAPSHDTYAGRTAIGSIPFTDSVDTTEATTDADDAEANASCGAPATDASVWYELTAATDGVILVDVSASDYSAGVIVVTGSPGTFSPVTCGAGFVAFGASAGEAYAILAFDFQGDRGGNGGTLAIAVDVAPPPPTVDLTVNPVGRFNKVTGSATINGTLTCTDADFAFIEIQLTQTVGRFAISGFGAIKEPFLCDGTAQPWSVEVFGSGKFKGGRAASMTFAFACGLFECRDASNQQTITLRG